MKPLSLLIPSSLPRAWRAVGFTLVEIAIVVLIGAILLTAGLSLVKSRLEIAQLDVTQKKQDAIKQALISYLGKYKRLPCPDVDRNGREDRDPNSPYPCGLPGTPQYVGGVPYADLGLERSAALDGWENYIRYIVSPNWRFTYGPALTLTTSNTNPTTTFVANAAFVPKVSQGTIALYSNTTLVPILDPCINSTGAVVALVSHGKNGLYATNVSGNTNTGPVGPSDETQNSVPTSTPPGVPAYGCVGWNMFRIVKHDATDTFDDVVMTISEAEFTGPLIASGSGLGSPDAALAKANDIILGAIAGSRYACGAGPSPAFCATGYYYALPATFTAYPSDVLAFGVLYTVGGSLAVDSANPTPSTTVAYTLTAPGATPRAMTVGELRIILTRVAGFI